MTRVFVTGLGGCGVGEGIAKALLMKNYQVFGSSSEPFFPVMKRINTSFQLPLATAPEYLPSLIAICKAHGIKAVFPGSEIETKILSERREALLAEGLVPMVNTPRIVTTFQDSWTTYQVLKKLGFVSVPDTCLPVNEMANFPLGEFPLIIKPVFGHGSKHINIVENEKEFTYVLQKMKVKKIPVIVQKVVGCDSEEYTVGVFSDKNGRIISSIAMKRNMIAGATLTAHIDGYTEIEEYCAKIAVALDSRGPLNVQLRKVENKFYVFEINPRFSGTTPFRAMVGINEPDMMFKNTISDEALVPVTYKKNVIIMRMFDEVMVDKETAFEDERTGNEVRNPV